MIIRVFGLSDAAAAALQEVYRSVGTYSRCQSSGRC